MEEIIKKKDAKGVQSSSAELFAGKPKINDIAIFCRQFATIIQAGVSIMQALDLLIEQMNKPAMKNALVVVYEEVKKGKTFSEGLKATNGAFPEFLINMIKVGELSGNLDDVMNRMAEYYEKDTKVRRKVKGAFTYPIAILVVTIGVVIFLINNVVPTFVGMMSSSGGELPAPTQFILGLSKFMKNNGLISLVVVVAAVVGCVFWGKTPNGQRFFDGLVLKMPVIKGVMQKVLAARFARTMSILITSGIPIVQSLEILKSILGNKLVEDSLEKVSDDIKKGRGFAKPISEIPYFPRMLTQMIGIGEETGSLDTMLTKTADMYDDEVDSAITQATTLIEPMIIVVIGGVVGFVVLAMIMPVFSLYDSMS